jgi:acyl-CoA synthetase (AMP-forming)/AMP-acid ligase II
MAIGTRQDPSGWQVRWDEERARRLKASGEWRDKTMADFAAEIAAKDPQRVLIVDGDTMIRAGEVHARARKLAAALIQRGLKPGDRVSYQLPNWGESIVVDLACTLAGLVVNPLVPIFRDAELTFMMGDCGAKLVFIPAEFRKYDYRDMLRRVQAKLPQKVDVVVLRGDAQEFIDFEALVASGDEKTPLPKVDPDAVKLILYTSGTTGRPKGVLHTHNTFDVQGRHFAAIAEITGQDVLLVASPVSHITGVILAFQLPWLVGCRALMMETWNGEAAIDLYEKHGFTFMGGATPFLRELYLASKARNTHLPKFRMFLCGGAAVPSELMRLASDHWVNASLFRCHGCTEVPSTSFGIPSRDAIKWNSESDGHAGLSDLKLVDPVTGGAIRWGDEGEVLLRGPQMMLGYLRAEDNANAFDEEGYFRTGDLAKYVMDDWIVISGRKKDLIIRAGENLSPKEIEDALFDHPAVAEIAVVGMPDERTGEAVCAYIVPNQGQTIDLPEVSRYLQSKGLAKQKIPARVELAPELPKTPSGKVQKNVLRDRIKALVAGAAA